MSFRIGMVLIVCLLCNLNVNGQKKSGEKFFYDTLTIMDYTTYEESVRLSQMRKPMTRTFYLKSDDVNYTLFKNSEASMTADQVVTAIESGFTLYLDKMEHKQHSNLKPGVIEFLDEENEVIEMLEPLSDVNMSVLKRKLLKDTKVRLSGFIISVNEKKNGKIIMDIVIKE